MPAPLLQRVRHRDPTLRLLQAVRVQIVRGVRHLSFVQAIHLRAPYLRAPYVRWLTRVLALQRALLCGLQPPGRRQTRH